jgi:hypothetical protein
MWHQIMAFGKEHKREITAEEPFDIAGVIDAPPQRWLLSKIVDSDLFKFGIRLPRFAHGSGWKTYAEGSLLPIALGVLEKRLLRSLRTIMLLLEWWSRWWSG